MVSLVAAIASTPARMGPMQGVQPKAKAKPIRKPLVRPGWPPRLRKWASRLSQRVRNGPARKISETDTSCTGPSARPRRPGFSRRVSAPATSSAPISSPTRIEILLSQPTRCRPNRTISAPASGASRLRLCTRKRPTALADAPKVTKTTENPATKATEDPRRLPRGCSPCRSCSTPIPESMEM